MAAEVGAQSQVPIQELVDLAVVWACQHGLVSPLSSETYTLCFASQLFIKS